VFATKQDTQVTFPSFRGLEGVGIDWDADYKSVTRLPGKTSLGFGVYHIGAIEMPNGDIVYSGSDNSYFPPTFYAAPHIYVL